MLLIASIIYHNIWFFMTPAWFAIWVLLLSIIAVVLYYYLDIVISLIRTGWVPYVPSFTATVDTIIHHIKIQPRSTVIDLGCGDGKVLRLLSKKFHLKKCIWYDIASFPLLLGRILNTLYGYKHIDLRYGNFLDLNIPSCDYIYCYLLPSMLAKLELILQSSLDENTIVISNTFAFPHRKPRKIITSPQHAQKIFLYKK